VAAVMITGSTGLIGRWVRHLWPPEAELYEVSRAHHDLLLPGVFASIIRSRRPSTVVHLAWAASSDPEYRTSDLNTEWFRATLDAINASLSINAEFFAVGTVIDDQIPADAYSAAKSALRAALAAPISSGQVTWLRPHYVFDPSAGRPRLLRAAMDAAQSSSAVSLRDPYASHDFVHAADVGAAIVAAVFAHLRGVIDIGSGRLHTVSDLVEACGAEWWAPSQATPTIALHDHRVARITPLTAIGWRPTETERYFANE
jgi:nucleoside-diphosphate-sugar epimerase